MAYLDKEIYEKKQAFAENRNKKNAEIETLTEDQHDTLSWICAVRHELHCNQDDVFNSESSYYSKFCDIFGDDGTISKRLNECNLPNIELTDISDIPTSDDYYEILNENERSEWEDKAELYNETAKGMYHTGSSLWKEQSDSYNDCIALLESLNKSIENYLAKIDKIHGTQYCPTGASRIF